MSTSPSIDGQDGKLFEEKMIHTEMLESSNKRFYFDVKENYRGRFIKIAEITANGNKNRILFPMDAVRKFLDELPDFRNAHETESKDKSSKADDKEVVKSKKFESADRHFNLELRKNTRGWYLRVVHNGKLHGRVDRRHIVVPAAALQSFEECLNKLYEEYKGETAAGDGVPSMPESQTFKGDQKQFYLDIGVNRRGAFLKVSEVRKYIRTSITVPGSALKEFQVALNKMVDDYEKFEESVGKKHDSKK